MGLSRLLALPDANLAALALGFLDHPLFCRSSLKIRDRSGNRVPFLLSPAQQMLSEEFAKQETAGQPVRIILLKSRQVHASAGCATEFFHRIPFQPGRVGAVVAHRKAAAQLIHDYYQQYIKAYKEQPFTVDGVKIDLPKQVRNSMEESKWANGSALHVLTAGSEEAGRSFSAQYLHLSEVAFYEDAVKFFLGLLQVVPYLPGTAIVIESTANGVGNAFHQRWCEAIAGNSAYKPLFFPWHYHPEYRYPVEDPARFQDSLDPDEQRLMRLHGITLEQLAWRRRTITDNCQGSVDNFRQEYPTTPDEAFLTSGRTRFDMGAVGAQTAISASNGELRRVQVGIQSKLSFQVRQDGHGALRVWRKPEPGRRYVIGADAAQGIDVGVDLGVANPDYSVACVLDRETGEQVAQLRARLVPSLFGQYLCELGHWYNRAYLVPESNGVGIAVLEEILRQQYPLTHLHIRRRNPDDRRPPMLEEIGFKTSTVTKPLLIERLYLALMEESVRINDDITLSELRTYITDAKGATNGSTGCHDDTVIALGLAIHGLGFAPREVAQRQEQLVRPQRYGGYEQRRRDEDDD